MQTGRSERTTPGIQGSGGTPATRAIDRLARGGLGEDVPVYPATEDEGLLTLPGRRNQGLALSWQRGSAQLVQEAQEIGDGPLFDDLAVLPAGRD
jgi:hypothetical protein